MATKREVTNANLAFRREFTVRKRCISDWSVPNCDTINLENAPDNTVPNRIRFINVGGSIEIFEFSMLPGRYDGWKIQATGSILRGSIPSLCNLRKS